MNVEIGTEAAKFPEKEYINGIFVAVQYLLQSPYSLKKFSPMKLFKLVFLLKRLLTIMEMSEKCNLYSILSCVWNGYHTVILFVKIIGKFGICTVVGLNGTLLEA